MSKTLSMRMSDSLHSWLESRANKNEGSVSEEARRLLIAAKLKDEKGLIVSGDEPDLEVLVDDE